jgi:hypothetical protein
MITVYRYTGKFGDDGLPADYIPCLIGIDEHGDEAYFETVGEIDPSSIGVTKRSRWVSHPVQIIGIKYSDGLLEKIGYVMADELLTAGVNF